ncbi:MAG: hypothetical protein L3J37_04370 [Rhodobacteraceae bacterium]|nr:hypothetical protein [Paracoccaceae bacterium]
MGWIKTGWLCGALVSGWAGALSAQVLVLDGNLESGAAVDFVRALTPEITTVELRSQGGYLAEGVAIGRLIRARGLNTVVPAGARCLSACAEAFLGGVERRIFGVLAFHVPRVQLPASPQAAFGAGYAGGALMVEYRFEMGFGFALSRAINRWTDSRRLLVFESIDELEAYRFGPGGLPHLRVF